MSENEAAPETRRFETTIPIPIAYAAMTMFALNHPDAVTERFWVILALDWRTWLQVHLPAGAGEIETRAEPDQIGMVRVSFVIETGLDVQ